MIKKILVGIIIFTIIIFTAGTILYAYPKEHQKKENHANFNNGNNLNLDKNKKTINITDNGYTIRLLPPVGINNQKEFKLGRTIPVKFILTDKDGKIVRNDSIRLYLTKIEKNKEGNKIKADSVGKSNNDNYFRFSKLFKKYIFNLSTKNLSAGTWRLVIDLGNGTVFNVNIMLE